MRRAHRFEIASMERPATFLVGMGFLVMLGGLALMFSVAWRRGEGWGWGVVTTVLGLLALLQFVLVLRQLASYARFGRVHLYLEQPPEVGRELRARLQLPRGIDTAGFVAATLECHGVTWNYNRDAGQDSCVWSAERKFPLRREGADPVAEIAFQVPAERSATTMPPDVARLRSMGTLSQPAHITQGQVYYDWMLKVHVEAPGPDLDRTYFVPVRPASPA